MPEKLRRQELSVRSGSLTLILVFLCTSSLLAQSRDLAGIAHVAFRVRDAEKSRDFYRSLGFEQAFEFSEPGKPPVFYIKVNDRQFIELYGRSGNDQQSGLLHVCYEVADIDKLWNEYSKLGLNPTASRKARAGNLLFTLRDPEGQLLEYTQYLPGSLHYEDRGKHLGEHRISQHLARVAVPVDNLRAAELFYASKLAFQRGGASVATCLLLPGNSGDEVELEAATPSARPRLDFAVAHLAQAADYLRVWGIPSRANDDSVAVTDPDGVVILFILEKDHFQNETGVKPRL